MVCLVAADVKEVVLNDSGHFVPEELPDAVVGEMLALCVRVGPVSLHVLRKEKKRELDSC